jgi:uncharacterized protein YndB with AHSA1/START domain
VNRSFTVTAPSRAPVEHVWALLASAASWPTWAPMVSKMRYERDGAPTRDGVGAIRFFGTGPMGSREEVTAFDPPHHLAYRVLSGLPVRGYRSEVTLATTADGGTAITWASQWDAARPGRFWSWFLRRTMQQFASRLAARAGDGFSSAAGRVE